MSRRGLLGAGAAGTAGLALGVGIGATASDAAAPSPDAAGRAVAPFHGAHQAGIATPGQAAAVFLALDLEPGTDTAALGRLMRLWTDDARRLTQGEPALGDTEPEMAAPPRTPRVPHGHRRIRSGSVRCGGPAVAAARRGRAVARLPRRPARGPVERGRRPAPGLLRRPDDPTTLAHAVRMHVKDGRTFATVRWMQRGFLRAPGVQPPGTAPRNLLGQIDGSANPTPGSSDFDTPAGVLPGRLVGRHSAGLRHWSPPRHGRRMVA